MYKISFYAPATHVEKIKEAMFAAHAGKVGEYSCCAWQVLGEGQSMPLEKSHAYIGKPHQLEKVAEYKVQMVCEDGHIKAAIAALKQAHPYEEPAYQVIRLEDF